MFKNSEDYVDFLRKTFSRSISRFPIDKETIQLPHWVKQTENGNHISCDNNLRESGYSENSVAARSSLYKLMGGTNRIDTANYNKSLESNYRSKYLDLVGVDKHTRDEVELKLHVEEESEEEIPPRFLWTGDSYGHIKQLCATGGNKFL